MKLKPKMTDVAKAAGVSPTTVARFLYSNGPVGKDKQLKIQAALEKTGYRPNVMARALRTSRSFTLGLVVSEEFVSVFHTYVAQAVQKEALRHGYTILTVSNGSSAEIERLGVQRLLDQHVDAVLFSGILSEENLRLVDQAAVPIVQIEHELSDLCSFANVDPRPGMLEAISHLHELGHERIGYVGAAPTRTMPKIGDARSVEFLRVEAFREALKSVGLTVQPNFIKLGKYPSSVAENQPGRIMMESLLDLEIRPTAVVFGSDSLAAGGLQAIHERKLRVPEDISVIGHDDVLAEVLTPPLASIAQPIPLMGQNAVTLALELINDPDAETRTLTEPTTLILRQSTAQVKLDRPRALSPR